MFDLEQARYLISLISQDSLSMLNELEQSDTPQERKAELSKNLEISNQAFQKIVTSQGIQQSQISVGDRVLIIDDTRNMLNVMRAFVEDIGFGRVETASDGLEAWNMITDQGDYGLIISDWEMPKMDGLELLKKVRGDAALAKLPFIIVSSTNQLKKVQMAIQAGVTDYMVKPVNQKLLAEKLQAYLGKS
ncbi:MAG: response regulator [Chromatiaceae bacterium]|nr:response regulator [Chromatiaceae bacterium]MCP5442170.1 response regulator [Chromatiaceae bacterium]